jgi:putative inorganic carbon (hco3(-)) transporter
MMQSDLLSTDQPDSAVPATPSPGAQRSDPLALVFLAACALLAVPLLFAARLPQGLLTLVVLALLAAFITRGVLMRSWLPRTAVDWPNILLLLLLPVGLWASTDRAMSWPVVYKVIAGFAIFYGLAGLAGSRWTRTLPWLLLAAAATLAVLLLLGTNWTTSKLAWVPDTVYTLLPALRLPGRTEGFHPNVAGAAIAWLLLPAVALAAWAHERRLRAVAVLTASMLALVLLLSQSRGAWLAVAAALLAMPILRYRRWWMVVAALLAMAAAAGLALGPDRVQGLLFPVSAAEETAVNTLPGRLELWTRALYILRDFGPTGVGPGQFERIVLILYPPFFIGLQGNFHHAHNLYLQAAIDFGVLGLVAFGALLLGIGASIVAATRRWSAITTADQPLAALAAGVFGSLVALAVHGLVDAPQVAPPSYVLIFALFGAAMAACSQLLAPQIAGELTEPSI